MLKLFSNWYYHFGSVWPDMPKLTKTTSLLFLYNKKGVSDAVDFLCADKHEKLLKIDTEIFWWVWSSISKVPKIESLQCLYNISKKKLWIKFIMEFIKIKTSASWIIDFWWKSDLFKVFKKENLFCFYNILRKSIVTVFVFYCDAKHSDTLQGSSHVCCYLFFCEHSNCPNSARTVPVFGVLFRCPRLNQFLLVFIFLTKNIFTFT